MEHCENKRTEVAVEELLEQLAEAKAEQIAANEKVAAIQTRLLTYAQETESKTLSGDRIKATVVTTERVAYNEKTLKKALGVKLWNTIKKESVDSSKLKSQVSKGLIDPIVVAQNSTITKSKPYLRISEVDQTQPQDS